MLVVKRLSDAERDGDPIVALVRGSAVNQDGASSGLTVPNRFAQEEVIRAALAQGGIDPLEVGYVEAHGTATPLGDPIEVGALATVYGAGRTKSDPLLIGSVKTNIGHLEAAAGLAGLIKLALALQHRELPSHLHFDEPNGLVEWDKLPVKVTSERVAWQVDEGQRRLGAVSSFGFSGTNAHVVLEERNDQRSMTNDQLSMNGVAVAEVFVLSAPTETGLRGLAERYGRFLQVNGNLSLADVCYTARVGRGYFEHFAEIKAESIGELSDKLIRFAHGEMADEVVSGLRGDDWEMPSDFGNQRGKKVVLPSYPFERKRVWPDGLASHAGGFNKLSQRFDGWRLRQVRVAGSGGGIKRFEVEVGQDRQGYSDCDIFRGD